jgi:colicin import membrane protein
MSFVGQHRGAIVWSVVLHTTALVAVSVTFRLPARPSVPAAAVAIQGVVVDQAVLDREVQRREDVVRRERERQQRQDRERREAAERERERVAAAERERVATAKREEERVATERRAAERKQQEQREREAREKREREAAAQREREAAAQRARQQQAERELQDALAAERAQQEAVAAGLLDQYMFAIETRVKQFWSKPLSARSGIDCVVSVTQLPTGDVLDARVTSCNGDDAVRRSIEKAVRDASPLPRAPSQAVFSRTFTIRFRPDE